MLLHGNPGQPTDWLTSAGGPRPLASAWPRAVSRSSSSCPTVLQNSVTGDSLCVDTRQSGQRGDVHHSRTWSRRSTPTSALPSTPSSRGIGGLSMGGFCALNLGPQASRPVLGRSLDFSGETAPVPTPCPAGYQAALRRVRTGSRRPTRTARRSTGQHAGRQQGPGDLDGLRQRRPDDPAADADACCPSSGRRASPSSSVNAPGRPRLHVLERRAEGLRCPGRPRPALP